MLENVAIKNQISVAFDVRFPISGEVVGVERETDDAVCALLIMSPQVEGGTIYFTADELAYASITMPGTVPVLN